MGFFLEDVFRTWDSVPFPDTGFGNSNAVGETFMVVPGSGGLEDVPMFPI
jgi:hypothetical protein